MGADRATEPAVSLFRDPDRSHEFRERLEARDTPTILSVGIEHVGNSIHEPSSVRGLLRLGVEDRDAVLGRHEALDDDELGGPGRREGWRGARNIRPRGADTHLK